MSSTDGWPTNTCWKRRSRAASFSMCLRNSSSVVAPIMRSSPRASIGLIMLPASIDPFGRAGADDGVHLVDEGDDLALGVGDLLEHGLEPLLELAAVLGPGDHRREVERDEPLVAQALGHVALDDAAGQALDDRRLADTGLADEHGVVLGAPAEHLDDAADLVVAADDRIDLAGARRLGEVAAVLLERLVLLLGVLAGDAVAAAHLLQRLEQLLAAQADLVGQGQQEVLGREVLVGELAPVLVGRVEERVQLLAHAGVAAVGLGQLVDGLGHLVAHRQRGLADLLQDREDHALLLAEQRRRAGGRG